MEEIIVTMEEAIAEEESGSSVPSGSNNTLSHSELENRARVLQLKNRLLESSLTKCDAEETRERVREIRSFIRSFEGTEYETSPSALFITSIIENATHSANLINAAINASNPRNPIVQDEDDGIKIKPLKLPSFNGDLEQWQPFWEQFSSIHNSSKRSKTAKFRLLNECLKGTAKRAIEGITPSELNYEKAIQILTQRYGDPKKLASIYYSKLERLPRAVEAGQQRNTFDEIQKILANLTSLGNATDEEYLKERILRKFSLTTLQWVWSLLEYRRASSVEQLMSALNKVVSRDEDITHFFRDESVGNKGNRDRAAVPVLIGSNPISSNTPPQSTNFSCIFCNGRHKSEDCRKFGTLQKRKAQLITLKRCLVCAMPGHRAAKCVVKGPCPECNKMGHSIILCVTHMIKQKEDKQGKGTFLETFICEVQGNYGFITVRGILDGGSLQSYISEALAKKLKVKKGKKFMNTTCRFGTEDIFSNTSSEVLITLKNKNSIVRNFRFHTIDCITGRVISSPNEVTVKKILPGHLSYADPENFKQNQRSFDILIGNDLYHKFVNLQQLKPLPCGVVLKDSFFGWIPSGSIDNFSDESLTHKNPILTVSTPHKDFISTTGKKGQIQEEELCSLFWSLEVLGIRVSENEDIEDLIIQKFRETTYNDKETGRFIVRWPWKHEITPQQNVKEIPKLSSTYRMCIARLRQVLERSSKDVIEACEKNFKDQENLGIIEHAPDHTIYKIHYVPHQALFQKNKLRVVFDASAKTSSGHSLNELLYAGPKLLGDLVGLILNFRLHLIALIADIEKAFLQMMLNEVDRDVTRFLWVKDTSAPITQDNIIIFRFARVPFGVISSPFLLNMCIQEILTSNNHWLSLGRKHFYSDNLVISVKDTASAINLHDAIKPKLATVGFNLRDWTSNDKKFVDTIPKSSPITSEPISVLGLDWNRQKDILSIKIRNEPESQPASKRSILKYVSNIFDPLGLISPATLPLKILVQDCWKSKINWDSALPPQFQARWIKLCSEAEEIKKIEIPRRYWTFNEDGKIRLHIFCDASAEAYACVTYLTYANENDGNLASSLIFSKVRTAPIKKLSIPRLELLGVLIGKRITSFLLTHLQIEISEVIIWTDATTILQWLHSTSVQPKFVENRLLELRKPLDIPSLTSIPKVTFRYVPTSDNPADLASRGTKAETLSKYTLWWKGPSWLTTPQLWPTLPQSTEVYILPTNSFLPILLTGTPKNSHSRFLPDEFEKRFSSWNKYVRLYGMIIQFCSSKLGSPLREWELYQQGEKALVKAIQHKYFFNELRSLKRGIQPNYQLELFLDESNIIRCKGRLQNASFPWETIHPILLPRNSPLTEIYIRELHVKLMHIGCNHLLAKIRERFWIPKGRAKVKSIIHHCQVCRRWTGGSYQLPPLPPLPWVRVTEAAPFLHCGLDYIGPITIKNNNVLLKTAHIALFVCLVTRAVHLEIARNASSDEFLMAFIRFTSRRGIPRFVISDNAANFTFVQPLVGNKVEFSDPNIIHHLSINNIEWKFIPQYAPWHGSAYERLVALAKNCFIKAFGIKILDYVELLTALCQIEDIINSRPLTYVSDELLSPLTPNHMLRLRTQNENISEIPLHNLNRKRKQLLQHWQKTIGIVEDFWQAFRSLYLLSLREKHSSVHPHKKGSVPFSPKIGDVVLVKDPKAPRAQWKMGKIESLDKRNAVAKILVPVNNSLETTTRAINHLFPLEISETPSDIEPLPSTSTH